MVGFNENSVPDWLQALLSEKFFEPCCVHVDAKKNERNVFCLDCSVSICPHCLPLHRRPHRLLQIRRYVYHDVVRLGEAQRLMNCSSVQSYTTNSAKVVFLKPRPMSRPFRGSGNFCATCDRSLQEPFLFCSLSCKVHRQGSFSDHLDDDRVTPDSVLDSVGTSSGSTTTSPGLVLACTATTEIVRRKRSTVPRPTCRPVLFLPAAGSGGRRKSAPQRSPLY